LLADCKGLGAEVWAQVELLLLLLLMSMWFAGAAAVVADVREVF
jgi:hypothetical protein